MKATTSSALAYLSKKNKNRNRWKQVALLFVCFLKIYCVNE